MDFSIAPSGAAPAPALPSYKPDQRPAADAVAIARDTTPDVPLPIPAGFAPLASINQARIAQTVGAVAPVERTLKPYGVTMLPHGPSDTANTLGKPGKQGSDSDQA